MTSAHYVRETFRICHLDAPPKPIMGILSDTKAPGYLINDNIARVLAEMQREYAKAAKHEPNNGTHQTL